MSDKEKRNAKVSWVIVVAICAFVGVFLFFSFYQGSSKPLLVAKAEKTVGLVQKVKGKEKSVYQTIRENLRILEEVKKKVEEAEDPSSLYDKAVEKIEKVTRSFQEMAERKEDIKKNLQKKAESLYSIREDGKQRIEKLKDKKADLEGKLRDLPNLDLDPGVRRVKEKAYSQTIEFVKKKIKIWEKFVEIQGDIRKQVKHTGLVIDKFLTAIEATAMVYDEGLGLLKLGQNLKKAKSLLQEMPDLKSLTSQMVSSWESLDKLVTKLLGQVQGIEKLEDYSTA